MVVEVDGKRLEVKLPVRARPLGPGSAARRRGTRGRARKPVRRDRGSSAATPSGNALTSPMQGTIVKIAVAEGDQVAEGDLIVVLEAMKMEQPLNAHRAGTVSGLTAAAGGTVTSGSVICEIVD